MSAEELTPKEQIQFSKIRFRRTGEENKYLRKFDTKIETFRFLQKVARRYGHAGKDHNRLYELCDEYEKQGIKMYPHVLSGWLTDAFGLEIQWSRQDRPVRRKQISVSISKEAYELYNQIGEGHGMFTRSRYFDSIFRHHAGLDIEDLIVYFGDKEYPVSVTFFFEDDECKALAMVELDATTRKLIQSLCLDAEKQGLEYVKTKCRALGYIAYGNNKEEI